MAIYTHRTITITRDEWTIPAPHGHIQVGCFIGALQAAEATYRHVHEIGPEEELHDDDLQVTGQADGSVVISYESRSALADD